MSQHEEKCLLDGALVRDDASCGGDRNGHNAEDNVDKVHPDTRVEEDDAQAAKETGAVKGVALVQLGLLRAGGGEGCSFATQEGREEEGANDGDCVIWKGDELAEFLHAGSNEVLTGCHPHHCTCVTLAQAVTSWDCHNPLIETVGGEGNEAQLGKQA